MKKNKNELVFFILLLIIIIGAFFIIQHMTNTTTNTQVEEYTPQEEISNTQSRQTIVTLYFQDKESKEITPEARLIDIKEILNTPVEKLINLLIEGPKNDKQERLIAEDVSLEKNYMDGDISILEFSPNFINDNLSDEKFKSNLINSIEKTLTQLTEVNSVKILINGEEFN